MGAITPLGHAGVLAKLTVDMKTKPVREKLNEEEQLAMVDFVLANPRCASYFTGLLIFLQYFILTREFSRRSTSIQK